MMSKEKKKVYIEEMKNFFTKNSSVFVTHYQGLTVKDVEKLKSEMRNNGIMFNQLSSYMFVPNYNLKSY